MPNQLQLSIIKVIRYFSIFAYYPTSEEIYTFLQAEISENSLKKELESMVKRKEILDARSWILDERRYTLGEYGISKKISNIKDQISKKKLDDWRYKTYIKLISLFPQIRLIGLSGSISMMNASEDDDIDLFIITAKNRLFTGRMISLTLAQIFGLRRNRESETQFLSLRGPLHPESEKIAFSSSHHKNKVCLNLFFDERNLGIPKFKQTEFVGHEVLQMKPIINKDHVYERFLEANKWVFRLFPNAESVFSMKYRVWRIKQTLHTKYSILYTLGNWTEQLLKEFQLRLIYRHKTTELISNTQLWFHPDDFEKKILKIS